MNFIFALIGRTTVAFVLWFSGAVSDRFWLIKKAKENGGRVVIDLGAGYTATIEKAGGDA